MSNHTTTPFKQVLGIGLLAGMRSAAAPAIASHILSKNPGVPGHRQFAFVPSATIADVLKLMAAGEFLADKLPFTPNRTNPSSVVVRCLSGALAGAGIFNAAGKKPLAGALLGAFAAGASTYASFYLRKALSGTGIGNVLSGVIEDAVVVSAGIKLASTI